jgi:hypothetical protein
LRRVNAIELCYSAGLLFTVSGREMSKPKLYCTHVLFDEPRRRLAEVFDADYWQGDGRPPRAEVLKHVVGVDALIPLLT